MNRISKQKFQQLIAMAIPLTLYLEQLSVLIVTKGLANVIDPPLIVTYAYYIYVGSVYGLKILRPIFTKFLKGYSRGFWIHLASSIEYIIQFVLVISAIIIINQVFDGGWIYWQLVLFIAFFSFTMFVRGYFLLIIGLYVLRNKEGNLKLKQSYWLMMTTSKQLYESGGRLIFEPETDELKDSLIDNYNSTESGLTSNSNPYSRT